MKLRTYLNVLQSDIDTYDNTFEGVVTVCHIPTEEFKKYINKPNNDVNYYRFCRFIYNNVDVISTDADIVVCDWTGLIKKYYEAFKTFMNENWGNTYAGDEFYYQWINEIHLYLAGHATEEIYAEFLLKLALEGAVVDAKNPIERSETYALMETTCDTGGVYESTVIAVSNNLDYLKTAMKNLVDKDYHTGGDFYTAGIDKAQSNEMKTVSKYDCGSTAYEIVKTELVNFVEV